MTYYDIMSPTILVHTPTLDSIKSQPQERYRIGHYPAQISARDIDTNLLHFWVASMTGDTARRFLYSYRIIEYVSFTHVESKIRSSVRRLLASPHVLDQIDNTVDAVVSAVEGTKLH